MLGGADLFLQGLIVPDQGLGSFASGDLMLASIPQNQFPFAIGVMEASSVDIKKNGLKGKGLKLLHHYPDMLWALGDKSVPDPSFTPTRVFPQVTIMLVGLAIVHCSLAHPHKLIAVCRLHLIIQCNKMQP